jgi:hypothetical protein
MVERIEDYQWGDVITATTTRSTVAITPIDKRFNNKIFTINIINLGAEDINVYPIDSQGGSDLKIRALSGGGQITEQFGWSTIAGGIEIESLANTTAVNVQVYSRDGPRQEEPEPVVAQSGPDQLLLPDEKPFLQVKNFQVS